MVGGEGVVMVVFWTQNLTSSNIAGHPILQSPAEASGFFRRSVLKLIEMV